MNEIKIKRKELGITQVQAAHACGVSRRTYQTYEETDRWSKARDFILEKLNEMGVVDGSNYIVSINAIKMACRRLFKEQYPEVKCAYLFGSYARGEATGKSDIDILVVCPPLGMKFFGIASRLEEILHKRIDLHTQEQLIGNSPLLEDILIEGVKVYEW